MQYSDYAARKPSFTFRHALWDYRIDDWDYNREYQRKLYAIKNPQLAILCPHYHVESCIQDGKVQWSYIAKTTDLVRYIETHSRDENRIRIFQPKTREKRLVVSVSIEKYLNENADVVAVAN